MNPALGMGSPSISGIGDAPNRPLLFTRSWIICLDAHALVIGGMESDETSVVHPSWVAVLADPVRVAVLGSLCELGTASAAELARHSHISNRAVRRHLDVFVELDLVRERPGESDGLTPGRPATRFSIDPEVRAKATALFELIRAPLGPWPQPASAPPRAR